MKVGKALSALPEIQEVHYVDGEDCYFIKLRVADTKELGRFIREKIATIEQVRTTHTQIALTTLKETSQIPLLSLG